MKSFEKEVRDVLREKAPEVKTYMWDRLFTGEITVYMRKDKGLKGYDTISKTFKSPKELIEFYGSRQDKKSVKKPIERARRVVKKSIRTVKSTLARSKSKKRNN